MLLTPIASVNNGIIRSNFVYGLQQSQASIINRRDALQNKFNLFNNIIGKLNDFNIQLENFRIKLADNTKIETVIIKGRTIKIDGPSLNAEKIFNNKIRIDGDLNTGDEVKLNGTLFFVEKLNKTDYRLYSDKEQIGDTKHAQTFDDAPVVITTLKTTVTPDIKKEIKTINYRALRSDIEKLYSLKNEILAQTSQDSNLRGIYNKLSKLNSQDTTRQTSQLENFSDMVLLNQTSIKRVQTQYEKQIVSLNQTIESLQKLLSYSQKTFDFLANSINVRSNNIGFLRGLVA